jgi:phosphoribosylformylglycinamidine cyclo-ligase
VGVRGVHGFAHISGGGVRNLVRLRRSVRFVLDRWPEPEGLYAWVEEAGHLPRRRLYETFNMGIGFTVVLDPAASSEALRRLHRKGYGNARIVGRVERGTGVDLPHLGLRYEGYQ